MFLKASTHVLYNNTIILKKKSNMYQEHVDAHFYLKHLVSEIFSFAIPMHTSYLNYTTKLSNSSYMQMNSSNHSQDILDAIHLKIQHVNIKKRNGNGPYHCKLIT